MKPEAFKKARKELGFSQSQLAFQMGKSIQTIQNYEQGLSPIKDDAYYFFYAYKQGYRKLVTNDKRSKEI